MARTDPKPKLPGTPPGPGKPRRASFSRGGLGLAVVLVLLLLAAAVSGYFAFFPHAFRHRNEEAGRVGEPSPQQSAEENREKTLEAAPAEPVLAPNTPPPAGSPSLIGQESVLAPGTATLAASATPNSTAQQSSGTKPAASMPAGSGSPEPTPVLAVAIEPGAAPDAGGSNPSNAPANPPQGTGPGDVPVLLKKDPEEERRVRQEVLVRVDLLKELTGAEKDHLYSQVERARGFTKLAIVPFTNGRVWPENNQVEHLLSYLRQPSFQKLFEDPTVVLVCAGYADRSGSEAQNLELSHRRAQNMVRILQTQTKIRNLMRAVGMGGSDLFDKTDAAKNRVVEIWLVQP